jgi:hypothetical protein
LIGRWVEGYRQNPKSYRFLGAASLQSITHVLRNWEPKVIGSCWALSTAEITLFDPPLFEVCYDCADNHLDARKYLR